MESVLSAFLVSFGVIFVAELGDKSQLMAMTFATRYRTLPVIVGITLATSLVHLVSVAVGHSFGAALPTSWIAGAAGIAFLGFGAWTLRGDELSDDEQAKAGKATSSVVVAVSVAFLLAELGDKTMLATIVLATQYGWVGVWLGSTAGMVCADGLAIVVGRQLGRRLPENVIRYGASALFVVCGLWLIVDATGWLGDRDPWVALAESVEAQPVAWIAVGLGILARILVAALRRWSRAGRRPARAPIRVGTSAWLSRTLSVTALLLGLAAPLLVAFGILEPIALLGSPGWVVVGAGLLLLGVAVVLTSLVQVGVARRQGDQVLADTGLFRAVRHPGFTGMVVATAGGLVMVPTLIGVLATVLIVAAVQIQARTVHEPGLLEELGEEYASYLGRTGRFLPRMRSAPSTTQMPPRAGS